MLMNAKMTLTDVTSTPGAITQQEATSVHVMTALAAVAMMEIVLVCRYIMQYRMDLMIFSVTCIIPT